MGKRIIAQARGHAGPRYRSPSHRYAGKVQYRVSTNEPVMKGVVDNIINDPGRTAPLARIIYDDGAESLIPAAGGLRANSHVELGEGAKVGDGNTLPLGKIPTGAYVYNIELVPNDGGKLVRASGGFATVMSQEGDKTIIKLPSRVFKTLDARCRATIGVAAGANRKAKPFVKAGKKHHARHARGKLYPITRARAMNAVDHKFGGSNMGVPKTVSRHAPPGRKVGSIAARRTGVRKGGG